MRRSAWKQCRSCSADSDSMWRGLVGQMRAGGMDALALGLQHPRDRVLGEPVDLQVRVQAAQLAGDRHVALGVAEPDRRGDDRARGDGRRGGRRSGRAVCARRPKASSAEVAQRQVDLDRLAGVREVAGAVDHLELSAAEAGERPCRRGAA